MPRQNPIAAWLKQVQKSWLILAQGGAWLLGVIGGFLLPPPVGVGEGDDKTWLRFAQFVAAILIGLIFFGVLKWKQKKDAKRWWLAALVSLLLGTASFFDYQRLTSAWTGRYTGQKVVIGAVYTPHGQEYAQKNPNLSVDNLLEDHTGKVELVWTRESINRRRLALAGLYVSCLPLFTMAVVAVVQAIQCLQSTRPPKSKKKRG